MYKTKSSRIPILLATILFTSYSCKDEPTIKVKADFQYEKVALQGESVQFQDLSDGQPTSWSWTFEGGTPTESTTQNPSTTYSKAGIYKVTLSVTNDQNTDTKTEDIEIVPQIEASFTSNLTSINQGSSIEFNDTSTGEPTSWKWTFPGGNPSTSNDPNPIVTFTGSGNHNVTLESSNKLSTSTFSSKVLVLPTNGLIVYFPFNGNTNDLSDKGNDGINSGASLSTDRFNNADKAFRFDGVDDKIAFEYVSELSNLPISISFWVNFDELKSSILGTDINDYYQSGVWFSIGQSNETLGKLALNFGNGGTPPGPDNRRTFLIDSPVEVNNWYHIVGIVENTNTMKIYIDGEEMTGTYSGFANFFYHSTYNGNIGRVWDPNAFFKGSIDDFRIYNRVLAKSEVSLLNAEH